ncbi:uncharacterized protein LOC117653166 [Thrips palmi]|uniref:Uncharacterized protein LOC117653166 n=1 Tax=Thrips palmi TaxID=161013 RepID=A0A6P9A911_THRPL|nr:uncharacterized protein LOC117653166 [Thrips palmi]
MDSPQKMNPHNIGLVDSQSNYLNSSSYLGTLEDIEPAWMENTTSFSESCGSCLSRISSLGVDGKGLSSSPKSSEGQIVPDPCGKIIKAEGMEDEPPFVASGSLQSLCSSSKTLYASPRSNSEDLLYCPLNNSCLSESSRDRQGNVFRERAPSENALDFDKLNHIRESKLSHSLHDVSSIPSNGLKNPSQRLPVERSSLSSLYLRNRSRDSGFMRSESLLSLSSNGRNYDHVESKVKHYIQSIKNADAVRRKERAQSKNSVVHRLKQTFEDNHSQPEDNPALIHIVQKMQQDMEEKDRLLQKLQEDYNCLLGKYAEAENKIDKLRFGWHENLAPPAMKNESFGFKSQSSYSLNPKASFSKQMKQPSALSEIDDCSLTSSMFLSNFENIDTADSSLNFKDEWSKYNNGNEKKKEVVISAPLRPISSLYCTSVRLDRTVTPLNSKSSVDASSVSSSHHPVQEVTIDTGIGSYFLSPRPLPLNAEPNEDPIKKVQRWQKSLHTPDSEFPSRYKGNESNSKLRKVFSSIGVQVNAANTVEFPSSSSQMSTPIVPMLCLGEVSGCTDSFSQLATDSDQSSKLNSSILPESSCSMLPKNCSSNLQVTKGSNSSHACEGQYKPCGCIVKSGHEEVRNKSETFCETKGQAHRIATQMNGSELAKLLSLMLKDQDHVVPANPEEERSLQHILKTLEMKINTLKSSVTLHTLVSLLDMLLDKLPSNECPCQYKHITHAEPSSVRPPPTQQQLDASVVPECSEMDGSLLQCLEELDEYTNQVWAKTESFLEVLNSNKCASTSKHH